MKRVLFLIVVTVASLLAAATEIRDTGYTGIGGVLFNGKILITAPDMTTADGRTVFRWQQEYSIVDGVISVDLEPNDTASPAGTSYTVRYMPSRGTAWTERWLIPTSGSPLKVNQVRIVVTPTPSLAIQPSQILSGGAAAGECLTWTGSSWAPATCGAAGSVVSVFGRSGVVTAQAGDYDIAKITGLQTALDAKATAGDLAAHAGSTNNPHAVTADQVGKDTAQWNADRLQGQAILATAPVDGQMMRYNASAARWEPVKVRHTVTFAAQTEITVTGATHGLGTADLTVTCYDDAHPPHVVEGDGWTINPSTFDVVIRFGAPQTGKCVLR
jgi:hypothetical protein